MDTLIASAIALIVGFIAGALVFRHNAAKAAEAQASLAKAIDTLKGK